MSFLHSLKPAFTIGHRLLSEYVCVCVRIVCKWKGYRRRKCWYKQQWLRRMRNSGRIEEEWLVLRWLRNNNSNSFRASFEMHHLLRCFVMSKQKQVRNVRWFTRYENRKLIYYLFIYLMWVCFCACVKGYGRLSDFI